MLVLSEPNLFVSSARTVLHVQQAPELFEFRTKVHQTFILAEVA